MLASGKIWFGRTLYCTARARVSVSGETLMDRMYSSLSGGELFERITAEGYTMSEAEVINYMRQICEGVKHMHERNIIHLGRHSHSLSLSLSHSLSLTLSQIVNFFLP